jgi:hypothetical protein
MVFKRSGMSEGRRLFGEFLVYVYDKVTYNCADRKIKTSVTDDSVIDIGSKYEHQKAKHEYA